MYSAHEKPGNSTELLTVGRSELINYIELDLWSKFQARLWKTVAGVLTLAAIGGVFGVPYYIRNEINARLQRQTEDFDHRTREVFAYSKLLALLSAKYATHLALLQADVLRLATALETAERDDPKSDAIWTRGRSQELLSLAARSDFGSLIDGGVVSRQALMLRKDEGSRKLFPPVVLAYENRGLTGGGGYTEPHPVLDGTLEGAVRDLQFRIVVLESLRRSMDSVQRGLLALGGSTKLDGEFEAVRSEALEKDVFAAAFSSSINEISMKLLAEEDRARFRDASALYLLGYSVTFGESPTLTPPAAEERALARHARLQ